MSKAAAQYLGSLLKNETLQSYFLRRSRSVLIIFVGDIRRSNSYLKEARELRDHDPLLRNVVKQSDTL